MYLYHLKLFWWNLASQIFLCSEPLGWVFRISFVFPRICWEYISVFGWDELANWGPDSWSSTGSMSPRKIKRLLWLIFRKYPWPNQFNCRSFQGKKSTMFLWANKLRSITLGFERQRMANWTRHRFVTPF
jgi:hypothetical protein